MSVTPAMRVRWMSLLVMVISPHPADQSGRGVARAAVVSAMLSAVKPTVAISATAIVMVHKAQATAAAAHRRSVHNVRAGLATGHRPRRSDQRAERSHKRVKAKRPGQPKLGHGRAAGFAGRAEGASLDRVTVVRQRPSWRSWLSQFCEPLPGCPSGRSLLSNTARLEQGQAAMREHSDLRPTILRCGEMLSSCRASAARSSRLNRCPSFASGRSRTADPRPERRAAGYRRARCAIWFCAPCVVGKC